MSAEAAGAPKHPWALGIGLALLLPQLVIAVLVVKAPFVVGLAGFLMTVGFIRLATLGSRVVRERRVVGRGALVLVGVIATVAGALLYAQVALAARELGDGRYAGVVAPPAAIGLDLVVILTLGLWIGGVVLVVGSALGALADRRARMRRR